MIEDRALDEEVLLDHARCHRCVEPVELCLAQLTPHWVYCREPAILGLELHRVLTAAAFEMPSWEEVPRLTCTEPYDPTGPLMFARNKANM